MTICRERITGFKNNCLSERDKFRSNKISMHFTIKLMWIITVRRLRRRIAFHSKTVQSTRKQEQLWYYNSFRNRRRAQLKASLWRTNVILNTENEKSLNITKRCHLNGHEEWTLHISGALSIAWTCTILSLRSQRQLNVAYDMGNMRSRISS